MLSPYMLIVLGKAQEGTYVLLIGYAVHQNRIIPLASSYTNDVYLLLGKLVGILLYSMLLCMKSPTPTVLFGFGEQRIRKSQFVFFHVKILHLKKRSEPQREEEKQENRLFYFITPLHRDTRSFPNRILQMKFPRRRLTSETTNLSLFSSKCFYCSLPPLFNQTAFLVRGSSN